MAAKVDYRKYNKKTMAPSIPQKAEGRHVGFNSLEKRDNMRRLWQYKDMYDRLSEFRASRRRNLNYTFGKQWSDLIEDPNSPYDKWITEEEHIKRQGKVPLKNNLIRQLNKSVLGTFRGNKTEPSAIARDRDEQKLGEMMSIAMQYVYQNNDLWEVDARTLEEFLISGMCVQTTRYKWWREKQAYDVYIAQENPSRCFFNSDMVDPRGEDLRVFGVLREMSIADVLADFAKSEEDAKRIRHLYEHVDEELLMQYGAFSSKRYDNNDFFIPTENNRCRVIEVWTLESKPRLRCHDLLEAEEFKAETSEKDVIDRLNQQRMQEAMEQGVAPEDVLLIEYEWMIDQFWCVQYLTPTGETLFEAETMFDHGSHPFAIKAYPLIDGEVHSFVEDVIDQQRYINRLITMLDFIMGASAKGVLVFPEEALGSMSKEEVLDEWVKYNGVIFAKTKNTGGAMPTQISTNATNIGAHELLAIQLKLMNDISGVHGAMQGQTPQSGTPAAMYAQEAQNAASNLLDLFETFNSFRRQRDYKMMKVIHQYYKTARFLTIAGKDYAYESKLYDPEKIRNAEFDISIIESPSTPAYRMAINGFLMELFQAQAIDAKMLLENSALPFADKILQSINRKEEEMMKGQAGTGGIPIPPELAQAADPKAMQLINQAIGGQAA